MLLLGRGGKIGIEMTGATAVSNEQAPTELIDEDQVMIEDNLPNENKTDDTHIGEKAYSIGEKVSTSTGTTIYDQVSKTQTKKEGHCKNTWRIRKDRTETNNKDNENGNENEAPVQPTTKTADARANMKTHAALKAYENEVVKLRRELEHVRHQYVNAIMEERTVSDQTETATDEHEEATLHHAMKNLERNSRGILDKSIRLPTEEHAQKRLIDNWSKSVTKHTMQSKLHVVYEELRRTEMIQGVLQADSQASGIQRVVNPECNLWQDRQHPVELTAADTDSEMTMMLDPTLLAEDFFNLDVIRHNHYRSTAMNLTIETDQKERDTLRAIVDSGAAWSAIDKQTLQRLFPATPIQESDRQFRDASANLMKVVGKVWMYFKIGDLRLGTHAYVFDGLGAPFLLGVNSLHAHGLAISTQRKVLFSEQPIATDASQEPIEFIHAVDAACQICPQEGGQLNKCTCASQVGRTLTCDLEQRTFTVSTPARREQTVNITTEQIPSTIHATDVSPTRHQYQSLLRTTREYKFHHNIKVKEMRLDFDQYCRGTAQTLEIKVHPTFHREFGDKLLYAQGQLASSLNKSVPFLASPKTQEEIIIPKGTIVGIAKDHKSTKRSNINLVEPDNYVPLTLRTIADPPASPLTWKRVETTPETPVSVNGAPIVKDRQLHSESLAKHLNSSLTMTHEEWMLLKPATLLKGRLRLSHYVQDDTGQLYCPNEELPFEEGGRPRSRDDLHSLGFSLDKAIDPIGKQDKDGNYPPLPEEHKERLYSIALRWYSVWSRDAKTPELSRLVIIDIPVDGAKPVAQKPYPLPFKYLEAVRTEVQKLLDGGLIEPCISNWASPILVRLKKDSRPDNIKLKLICDYRRLNEVTVPHAAGLGDQNEILHGFGGNQRYAGIVDAAGGFYQFLINPDHRHRTAFVLPTSMGGTAFSWKVAPYGLARNPAGYSQGMMLALKGLNSCTLLEGTGGASSWIDDVSLHADSIGAFAELFELILTRLTYAGMSLAAKKCFLLHQRLEVLGYYVTPDGLVMQEDKIEDLRNRFDKEGKPCGPVNAKEVRAFLGTVQFYRRFVPKLALLAAPMNALLKKYPEGDARMKQGTPEHQDMMRGVQQSYEAIMTFLQSSAIVAAPDFQDPLAEFVICPDACNVAVSGVLLQWQWPIHGEHGPGPPAGTPLRGGKGTDPLTQSWRLDKGWKLRTIEYYSKTLDSAQANYPIFDKEAAAILLCCRKWAQLITCHPTTIYTDSSVAASMLTKHLGPPRLQRWGMELGTFLPYLKIAHRAGALNGMADFLSRFPTFEKYVTRPSDIVAFPDTDFADVAEIPLFSHKLEGDDVTLLRGWTYKLKEESTPPLTATAIWQEGDAGVHALQECNDPIQFQLLALAMEVKQEISETQFWKEQQAFASELQDWQKYVEIFHMTHGRAPVLYDLYCGEGGFSRGARAAGCDCYGFDINSACKSRYEQEPTTDGQTIPSCMQFHTVDISQNAFWEELATGQVHGNNLPPPDMIHASPPCAPFSKIASMRKDHEPPTAFALDSLNVLIRQLREFEQRYRTTHQRPLIWQVENVPESQGHIQEPVKSIQLLCGTMMGHQVFRHRLMYSNYSLAPPTRHSHAGKYVGSRGVRGNSAFNRKFESLPSPNMYGIYSRPYASRGSAHEWHGALGTTPDTYSTRGLAGCLPMGYGLLTSSQMIAHSLHQEYGCPLWPTHELDETQKACLDTWADSGYGPVQHAHTHLIDTIFEFDNVEGKPRTTIPTDKPKLPASDMSKLPAATPIEEFKLPDEPFDNQFTIGRLEQLRDPVLANIIRRLELPERKLTTNHATLHAHYLLKSGLLYWRDFSHADVRELLMVPEHRRTALMRHYHYSNHRGHEPLIAQVSRSYWWPRLTLDCTDFTATCSVCGPVRTGALQRVPDQPLPSPCQPFSVIHVDHKGPLPRQPGCKFTNILVVVCALTRFTLLIPVVSVSAEDTLRELVRRVFCVFGTPASVVSDNGPAFISELNKATSNFYGYRHIHTLPYNPQANGVAEAAVKRIKLLLDRQTKDYAGWQKLLPLAQHMLNTTVHTGTGTTPFEAVFGREPIGLEQLENPALYPDGDGAEFLQSIKQRMLHLHKSLREASDSIKRARIEEKDQREYSRLKTAKRGTVEASTSTENKYIWLLYGSPENAAYIRKHGHGAPWRHRYKVLEVRPHAVRLEVPKDGSVPKVMEWQPMRRVSVARPDEHGPTGDEPYITESGLAISRPGNTSTEPNGGLDSDETEYEIERVLNAQRIGGKYKIFLKWKGYDEITFRWRHELLRETTNPELLDEIARATDTARREYQAEHGYLEEEPEEDTGTEANPTITAIPEPTVMDTADERPIAQRKPRRKGALLAFADSVPDALTTALLYLRQSAYDRLTTFKACLS